MLLNYKKLSQHPRVFRKLTGLSLDECREVLDLVSGDFDIAFPGSVLNVLLRLELSIF